jgi:PBP1b-binding outer membrane lipoprotein LpoB
MRKLWVLLFVAIAAIALSGCSGLRYSETLPEAKDFHPKTIGILPVDVGNNDEARGVIDKIVADALLNKKWFNTVVSAAVINQRMAADENLRKNVDNYLSKLNTVTFSDPQLSQKIGDACQIEAMLVVRVDYWLYTKEKDDKVAKAGFDMKLIDTRSGNIEWKAGHHEARSYTLFKPAIASVARDVVNQMLGELPH